MNETNGRGNTAFSPAITQGQKEEPCAPAFQHAFSTIASTLRCDTPGLIARMPSITADTVALAAARKATISRGLCTSISAEIERPTSLRRNDDHFVPMVISHSGASLFLSPVMFGGSSWASDAAW